MLGRRVMGGVGRRWKLEGGFEGGVYRDMEGSCGNV